MSGRLSWMPLYVQDYNESTDHLTCEQDGAYGRLLRRMWVRGDLPNDDGYLARICGVTRTRWIRRISPAIMPLMFITDDGAISQKRLQKEREKAAKTSEIRAEIARQRVHKTQENTHAYDSDINNIAVAIAPLMAGTNCEQLTEQLLVHTHKEESKEEHKPSVYDAGAPRALFEDVPTEVVKAKPVPHAVWTEGLEILAWAAGRSLPKDRDPVVRLLRKCQEAAFGNDDMLIEVLRTVSEDMAPDKQTVAVIKSMIAERGGAAIKGRPRLVIDNNDPHGIQAWCRSLPGVQATVKPEDCAEGSWMLGDWIVDWVARLVAEAVELPTPCRMDWSLLRVWLVDGIEPDFIIRRIQENVSWLKRKGSYQSPSSLGLFEAFVRGARKSA